MKKLVTHNGSFHSDDIFAAAALSILLENSGEKYEIIRTRAEEVIVSADYVFDVGGIYDEKNNRFDHHQTGGAGKRESIAGGPEVEYASFGLVWKKFGLELSGSVRAAELIDKKLAAPVDAGDNGFDLVVNKYEISPYLIQHVFSTLRPTWREENSTEDEMFQKCVELAKVILSREIIQTVDALLAEELVISFYNSAEDKRIIVMDRDFPFQYTLNNFPEPLFVIFPKDAGDGARTWRARAIREDPKTFNNRKDFPKSWAGLRVEELQKITGVPDAVFCHRGLFLAVAKSKEGAIKLAELALLDNLLEPRA
jgi:uncharacterized UPF0160 family protein